jgi:ABC-type multidrug transport system fused ATPase/permease subunit
MKKIKKYIGLLPEIMKEWVWMGHYMKRYKFTIGFYILLGLLGVGMGLVVQYAQSELIDAVSPADRQLSLILKWVAVMVSLAVSQIFISAVSTLISTRISIRVINEIREDIFRKMISTRWESLCHYHSGDLINRLEGDVNTVSSGVITFIPSLLTRLAQFIGALVIILVKGDPIMALFALISAPILAFSARPMMKIMRKHNEKMRDVNGRILSFNEEVFQNIQMVKAFDLGAVYCKNLATLLKEYRKIRLDYTKVTIVTSIVMGFLGLIAGYGCYGWGVWKLFSDPEFTYGNMALFMQLSGTLSGAFSALVRLVPSAVSTATAAGRVMEIIFLPAEDDMNAEDVAALGELAKEQGVRIEARDVCFHYEKSDTLVLDHVSFDVQPGQVVAFVGPSGGGKTTVLRLMLSLVKAESGSVTVSSSDGSIVIPLSENVRRLCSYVPQGNSIFSGTIESNLRAVKPDATDEEIVAALKTADAWSFVSALPDTFRAEVGEKGHNFSEGQLQRLSIARAMLRNSPILIMDEATSALDINTEARVLRNIMTANPYRICLLTTHRASMLEYSDVIFRVDGDGRFEQLTSMDELRAEDLSSAEEGSPRA